jgi:hypothetical protein
MSHRAGAKRTDSRVHIDRDALMSPPSAVTPYSIQSQLAPSFLPDRDTELSVSSIKPKSYAYPPSVAHEYLEARISTSQPRSADVSANSYSTSRSLTPTYKPFTPEVDSRHSGEIHERVSQPEVVESRRPEYFKRARRGSLPFERFDDGEHVMPGLDIAVSPMKGRRLQLFQETSEESFEQSLMVSGFTKYNSVDLSTTPSMHEHTLEWLQRGTSSMSGPLLSAPQLVPEEKDLTENERLKRKRLAAFRSPSPSSDKPPHKVRPVEVEGMGRLLLGVEEPRPAPAVEETPIRRRPKNRRRKAPTTKQSISATDVNMQSTLSMDDAELNGPGWLDSAFPWSLRASERAESQRKVQEQRLRTIENYLAREDSDDSEQSADEDEPVLPATIKISSGFRALDRRAQQNDYDAADARWQVARTFMRLHPPTRELPADAQLVPGRVCVCHRVDDGAEPLVQCDDCLVWYHPRCIGEHDLTEFDDSDEPWYCRRCTGAAYPSSPARTPSPLPTHPVEPAFAMDGSVPPLRRSFRTDTMLLVPPEEASPTTPRPRLPAPPTTPSRSGGVLSSVLSSRSTVSQSDSAGSRGGPVTPRSQIPIHRDVRVLTTPHHSFRFRDYNGYNDEDEEFDPSATPSRGYSYAEPPVTPKKMWSVRGSRVPWGSYEHADDEEKALKFETPLQLSPTNFVQRLLATGGSPALRSAKRSRIADD